MPDTAVPVPDPDEPAFTSEQFQAHLDRVLPGAKLLSQDFKGRPSGSIDVTDYVYSIATLPTNGRLDGDAWGHNIHVPSPVPPHYENWRAQVKANLRKKRVEVKGIPNRIKALPQQAREYARYRIHDHLIGWVLGVNVDPRAKFGSLQEDSKDDVFLHL